MEKQKILILVKTYPQPSKGYEELVCTAGLRENGTWVRLYPIPFRKLHERQQYKKYQWVELNMKKRLTDFRPESYSPQIQSIRLLGQPIDTKDSAAVEAVKKKYSSFIKKDTYLFLGTTHRYHFRSRNPFIIIGVFYPSHKEQKSFDF